MPEFRVGDLYFHSKKKTRQLKMNKINEKKDR